MVEKLTKNHKWKCIFMIVLTYLIPIINILFLINAEGDLKTKTIGICSVLSSTAAASACTIKGIKNQEGLNIFQAFALVPSVVSFICCSVFELSGQMYINIYAIAILTIIANTASIIMYISVNHELDNLIQENDEMKKEAQEMAKSARKKGLDRNASMKITPKGANKDE